MPGALGSRVPRGPGFLPPCGFSPRRQPLAVVLPSPLSGTENISSRASQGVRVLGVRPMSARKDYGCGRLLGSFPAGGSRVRGGCGPGARGGSVCVCVCVRVEGEWVSGFRAAGGLGLGGRAEGGWIYLPDAYLAVCITGGPRWETG